MAPALLILLLVWLFPCLVFFVASGFLLFVKPQGIRPPWWDWGMDKPVAPVAPIAQIELELESEAPEIEVGAPVVEPNAACKPSLRW